MTGPKNAIFQGAVMSRNPIFGRRRPGALLVEFRTFRVRPSPDRVRPNPERVRPRPFTGGSTLCGATDGSSFCPSNPKRDCRTLNEPVESMAGAKNSEKSQGRKNAILKLRLCKKMQVLVAGAPDHFWWNFGRLGFGQAQIGVGQT